mmetsp:Transcript_6088/g.7954  ORF Transcript_6088/g.7954 Transcript_6088/m.7954 type:complete len:104 (+) Transcript_6088:85-396(+)
MNNKLLELLVDWAAQSTSSKAAVTDTSYKIRIWGHNRYKKDIFIPMIFLSRWLWSFARLALAPPKDFPNQYKNSQGFPILRPSLAHASIMCSTHASPSSRVSI